MGSVLSPDQQTTAVVFIKNCGATTPYSYFQVAILRTEAPPLRSDTKGFFVARDQITLELKWISEHELLVTHPAGADVFASASSEAGVRVTYETR